MFSLGGVGRCGLVLCFMIGRAGFGRCVLVLCSMIGRALFGRCGLVLRSMVGRVGIGRPRHHAAFADSTNTAASNLNTCENSYAVSGVIPSPFLLARTRSRLTANDHPFSTRQIQVRPRARFLLPAPNPRLTLRIIRS